MGLTLVTASDRAFPCLRSPFCFLPSTSNFFLLYIRSKALGWALCSFAARQGLTAFFFTIYASHTLLRISKSVLSSIPGGYSNTAEDETITS